MDQEILFNITHDCSMVDADAIKGVVLNEGYDVAGKYPVAAL